MQAGAATDLDLGPQLEQLHLVLQPLGPGLLQVHFLEQCLPAPWPWIRPLPLLCNL